MRLPRHVQPRLFLIHLSKSFVAIALTVLALGPVPVARAGQRTMSPYDVARLRGVGGAIISPDGQKVAYLLNVPRAPWVDGDDAEKDGSAWNELHVVDLAGKSRPFITGEVNIGGVRWTPDGSGISFLAKRPGDKQRSLYVIPIDGGEARRVLKFDTDINTYDWAPKGNRVVFLAQEKPDKKKKKLRDKGFSQEVYEEELESTRVWIAAIGENARAPKRLDLPGSAVSVAWSPVGGKLAVGLAPTPLIDDEYMQTRVHIVDADSGAIVAKLANPGKLGPFAWSPDGAHLAILSAHDLNDPSEGCLVVAPAAGGPLTDLLPDFPGHVSSIAWQNATHVMYVAGEGVWASFGKVACAGGERKVLVPPGKFFFDGLTLSRDGQTGAFVGQSPEHPGEVFVMKHGDTEPRRLTDSNPWLKDIRLAKQEVVNYKARDGLDLEGLLIRPLDEKPGQRYPLVMVVHGGPEYHFSNGWLTRYANPGQVFAARGFAVFYPNYRGSTGRGVAFSKLDHGDSGGKEFDDLVDGVDHLINVGLVNKDKVGVTGGSYGGFATAWCGTYYSERFAAGVMFVGISDLISKAGTTDIANEMYLVHERKWPWEDWEKFEHNSPIRHVQKSKTPMLIVGGKDDTRVHPSQSMQLYRFLKLVGQAPVRWVRYPGEGHGNRRAASQLDLQLRLLQWMEHYLQGPGGAAPPHDLKYGEDAERIAAPADKAAQPKDE